MTAAVQRTAATISFITVPPEGPRPTDLTQMNAGLRPDYRCADTTNATPNPLAPLDERPHRDAHLRSAARHCHPPITRPSFMSRLETNPNDSGSVWRQQGGSFLRRGPPARGLFRSLVQWPNLP